MILTVAFHLRLTDGCEPGGEEMIRLFGFDNGD
jgi:hypothetical protein